MSIGTGIAIAAVWAFVAVAALAPEVSGQGLVLAMVIAAAITMMAIVAK